MHGPCRVLLLLHFMLPSRFFVYGAGHPPYRSATIASSSCLVNTSVFAAFGGTWGRERWMVGRGWWVVDSGGLGWARCMSGTSVAVVMMDIVKLATYLSFGRAQESPFQGLEGLLLQLLLRELGLHRQAAQWRPSRVRVYANA